MMRVMLGNLTCEAYMTHVSYIHIVMMRVMLGNLTCTAYQMKHAFL